MDTERQNPEIAEAIRIFVQEIPIFLTISLPMESEKKASAHGMDAAFDEEADFELLMLHAKAVIKWPLDLRFYQGSPTTQYAATRNLF